MTTLKIIKSLFKKAIKTVKKALPFHHCNILERHTFLSFDNFKHFKYACLVYKVLHNLTPPLLSKDLEVEVVHRPLSKGTV